MKLRHTLSLAIPLFAFSALSQAAVETCASKAQDIQTQIDYATKHGNNHRIAGLQKALSEVQAHCTEAGLQADRQQKIADKQSKVAEREQELKEAQETGKADKIANKQKKLAEAQAELQAAQAE